MVSKEPRLTHQTLKVLRMFLDRPSRQFAGSDIAKETEMLSGTLYPILMRLEEAQWLESEWEQLDPSEAGRPRKRLYRITGLGQRKAYEAFSEIGISEGEPAWS